MFSNSVASGISIPSSSLLYNVNSNTSFAFFKASFSVSAHEIASSISGNLILIPSLSYYKLTTKVYVSCI